MKKLNSQSQSKNCSRDQHSKPVEFSFKSKADKVFRFTKVFVPCSSNSCGSAGITSGTLSRPYHSAITNSQPFDFIGMNVSAVISPRGLSRKGVNLNPTWKMRYIHGESGVNFGDFMPSNGDLLQRVNNHKSLIGEDNFRMYENQVEQGAEPQAPSQTGQSTSNAIIQDIDVSKGANCKIGGKSEKIATAGSKAFDIAHKGIISRTFERAA